MINIVLLKAFMVQNRRLLQPLQHKFAEKAIDFPIFRHVFVASLTDAQQLRIAPVEEGR